MDTDSEEEIFFGPVTDREKQVALKFYEKFPGELRISSCLTYGIPGKIADGLLDRDLDESSARNFTVSEDLVLITDESKQGTMLETSVGNPSDMLLDKVSDESSVQNSTVSEDLACISDENKHGVILETNAGNPSDVVFDKTSDESPVQNSSVSKDLLFKSDENKHGTILETNAGNPSDVLLDKISDKSSVQNSSVSEDLVFISDENRHGIILETNAGNPSDVLFDETLYESSVQNSIVSRNLVVISDENKHGIILKTNAGNTWGVLFDKISDESPVNISSVSEDLVFISDENKHGVILKANAGNPLDVLLDKVTDESSVRYSTVSEDLVFISDKNKHGVLLETNAGNPLDVLFDKISPESSVQHSTVFEDLVFISDENKHGIILETNAGNPSDVLVDRVLYESSVRNSTVSEDLIFISDENKHSIILEANVENPSDVLLDKPSDESPIRNSTVSEDLVFVIDENKHGAILETNAGNPSDVLVDKISDESCVQNSTVSEDSVFISDENKHGIILEMNAGNPSDVLSHKVELESFEQTSPVREALTSPHNDKSEECIELEGKAEDTSDKLEGEICEGSSLITEKMLASPLHHECFCIALETNTNKLSDFEWLQEDSHTSETLVSPLNDGSKLGILSETELSVMLSEKTKDESSEGNYVSQVSTPPQNIKSEHNTQEIAKIESASQVSEKRTEDDVVENLSIEFAYSLDETFPPPGDYVSLEGNVPGSTEKREDKIFGEESLTIVDSRMSEDGIQIVEDCEGMEKVVSSGKCSPDKTSSKEEVEGNLKEMSNIFSMTLTIDDSKDIEVPEFCLSDEEEPENDLNNTLDLVNTIMLEHLYQRCSPSKLADLKRSIQRSVAATQYHHDTVNLVSDDDDSFADDGGHPGGGENDYIENKKGEYVYYDEKDDENEECDDNKESVETNYSRNVDPTLDVLNADKEGSNCNSYNESSHAENNNDVAGSNNVEEYTSSGQREIKHKSPDFEIPVKCPSKFGYSSLKVKPRSPASREKQFQKSPCQKLLHASTVRYREMQSPLQSYLRSEPTLIQVVKPKFKTPGHIKNFWCLEATPDATSTKEISVCPKIPLRSPDTLPVVRYTSRPTVDINGPGTPISATGPCEKVPGAITPIVTKHIGHVKIVNSESPLKLAESRLSIVQSNLAGRSDTLAGHSEASGKPSPSKFGGHRIPILKSNLAGRADMPLAKSKKEVGSKTELTPKRRGDF